MVQAHGQRHSNEWQTCKQANKWHTSQTRRPLRRLIESLQIFSKRTQQSQEDQDQEEQVQRMDHQRIERPL